MRIGVSAACELTGYPMAHGQAIQRVADQMKHAILFRAVGAHCTRLLEEGYATKGFRIDTKSCDWGPMRGFVCADPRLSKGGLEKAADNTRYTIEAVSGAVRHDAIGGLEDQSQVAALMAEWQGGAKPLVISAARYHELTSDGHIQGTADLASHVIGLSQDAGRQVSFPWRLIPAKTCAAVPAYRMATGELPVGGYGIFVDRSRTTQFQQVLPGMSTGTSIRVGGYEALLGLINPGTAQYGYRACVTGDYDLFGVWAPTAQVTTGTASRPDAAELLHTRAQLGVRGPRTAAPRAAATDWDRRFVSQFSGPNAHHHQHYQLGNITRRINLVKVMLNTALQSGDSAKYTGGMMVHHSDEVGNPSPGLRKSLDESFPLLAFRPGAGALALENQTDFVTFARGCQAAGIAPDLRPEWLGLLDR